VDATGDDLAPAPPKRLGGVHGRFAGLDPRKLVGPIRDAFLEARRQVREGAWLARREADCHRHTWTLRCRRSAHLRARADAPVGSAEVGRLPEQLRDPPGDPHVPHKSARRGSTARRRAHALTRRSSPRLRDVETTSSRISGRRQAALGTAARLTIVPRQADADALVSALSRSMAGRHLQVYGADATDQAIRESVSATGELDMGQRDVLISMSGATPESRGLLHGHIGRHVVPAS
jgi:hypothetical protein